MPNHAFQAHRRGTYVLLAVTVLLIVLGLSVRGIRAEIPKAPAQAGLAPLAEPLQFLARGASNRFEELTAHLSEAKRAAWRTHSALLFDLQGCPPLKEWCETREGQRLERLLAELRAGSAADALSALTLIYELARRTRWSGAAVQAEQLGSLLADWLRVWAEQGVEDGLLHEPVLATATFYGRVMQVAWSAPMLGHNQASYERARSLIQELCGEHEGRRAAFGRELELRAPRLFAALHGSTPDAFFSVFRYEAELLFPGMNGDCDG